MVGNSDGNLLRAVGKLSTFALLATGALAQGNAYAFNLEIRELAGGPISEFTYLINEDNTADPFHPDPNQHPARRAMPSHSTIVGAGDQGTATGIALEGNPANCPQSASTRPRANSPGPLVGCQYLISVRADGYKAWGRHIIVTQSGTIYDGDGINLNGNVLIELYPAAGNLVLQPLLTSNLEVQVFEDFAEPNGFPDYPREIIPEGSTTDMSGFHIKINDNTGQVVVDVDGTPICGTGKCLTDARGRVTITGLPHGKFEINAIPPTGSPWVQTTTFEGTKVIDAWLTEGDDGKGAPGELLREPGVETAHFFGFVSRTARNTISGGSGTITGTARNLVTFPPFEQLAFGEPVSQPWIVVTDLRSDLQVLVVRGNANGTFTFNVPPGIYQLMIFDEFLDYINAFYTVNVGAGATVSPGMDPNCTTPSVTCSVGIFRWFGWVGGHIFLDANADGIRQSTETTGLSGLGVGAIFRDGSTMGGAVTNTAGYYEHKEIKGPLGKFVLLEVDVGRFAVTGHSAHDEQFANFNLPDPNPTVVDGEVGGNIILNQEVWEGKRSKVDFGKQAYTGINNGGIAGRVLYATTRNEFDAALQAAEDYEPGIPSVELKLYGLGPDGAPNTSDDVLLNVINADAWNHPRLDNPENPVGCDVRQRDGSVLPGATATFIANHCTEVPMLGNETKPGAYDGGWAFGDVCPTAFPYDETTGACAIDPGTGIAAEFIAPIPPADYVVQVVPPPFYQIVKEEDNNTGEGNPLVPLLPPPPCVGDLHTVPDVPDYDIPFEGMDRPLCDKRLVTLQARQNPGVDIFLFTTNEPYVPVVDPGNPTPARSSWTSTQAVPVPGRFFGLVEDDINLQTDPNSLQYGEKRGVPGMPIGIYEFAQKQPGGASLAVGRRLTTIFTDANGYYEVLLPADFTANSPIPGGISQAMYVLVMNDPGDGVGPDGVAGTADDSNPGFSGDYLTEPAVRDVTPGKMTPTDTPVDPINTLVCGVPPDAPQIFQVQTPVVPAGVPTDITITGMRFGNDPTDPPVVTVEGCTVTAGTWTPATPFAANPVFEDVVTVEVTCPAGPHQLQVTSGSITGFVTFPGAGPLSVNGGHLPSRNGLTLHATNASYPTGDVVIVGPPADPNTSVIQPAIDSASPGDLIVLLPGTYRENVILHQNVKLQGYGPGGVVGAGRLEPQDFPCPEPNCPPVTLPGEEPFTHIPGSVIDGRFFGFAADRRESWNTTLTTEAIPFDGPASVPAGAGITVVAADGEFGSGLAAPQIDGLGISTSRGEAGGGIYVHAYGRNLLISNNIIEANQSTHGGAISLGQPIIRSNVLDNQNDNVRIHHNRLLGNGGVFFAGQVGIFSGADNYEFDHNDVCGGYSLEYGGGLSHWGLSPGGSIHDNRIYYNDAFDEGGGLVIAGDPAAPDPPGVAVGLGAGSGAVTIERNLIQSNLSNDDGGGIRLLNPLQYPITIVNNEVVNNVATDHGGGLALDNASDVRMVNNTVAGNVSTHTAEDSVLGEAHGAGLTVEMHAAGATSFTPSDGSTFSDPVLFNNIFHDNLAYHFGLAPPDEGDVEPGLRLVPTAFIDLEVFGGGAGACLAVSYSLLSGPPLDPTGAPCPPGTGNIVGDAGGGALASPLPEPAFVLPLSADRVEIQVTPSRFAANELVPFLDRPEGTLVGYTNYHLRFGSPAIDAGTAGPIGGVSPPDDDIDGESRPLGLTWEMGADETTGVVTAAGALQFDPPEYLVAENGGTVTITVTRAGGSDGTVTVEYRTFSFGEPGNATPGSDYVPICHPSAVTRDCAGPASTLTFPDGETSQSFTVTILDDVIFEPGEGQEFFVRLGNPTGGATLANGQPEMDATLKITENDPQPPPAVLYFSTLNNFAVPGVAGPYDDADIYLWDGADAFARVFDGTAAGLPASADIDAMVVQTQGPFEYIFYMSFVAPLAVPGLGTVDDSDIVRYDAQAGTWTMFFDGSDVSLTTDAEDVDAFEILSQSSGNISVLISTLGNPAVGITGTADEDLLRCTGTSGDATACTWSLYFDGSDVGLATTDSEDIDGAAVGGADIYFSTLGAFAVTGLTDPTSPGSDVVRCNGATTGPATACSSFTLFFDGSAEGITDPVDAFDLP